MFFLQQLFIQFLKNSLTTFYKRSYVLYLLGDKIGIEIFQSLTFLHENYKIG